MGVSRSCFCNILVFREWLGLSEGGEHPQSLGGVVDGEVVDRVVWPVVEVGAPRDGLHPQIAIGAVQREVHEQGQRAQPEHGLGRQQPHEAADPDVVGERADEVDLAAGHHELEGAPDQRREVGVWVRPRRAVVRQPDKVERLRLVAQQGRPHDRPISWGWVYHKKLQGSEFQKHRPSMRQ